MEQLCIFDQPTRAEIHTAAASVTYERAVKPGPTVKTKDEALADKLEKLAHGITPTIEDKFRDRQTNTPKRLGQAMHARADGERLQRTQQALITLAKLHRIGECPDNLAKLRSKKAVHDLMAAEMIQVPNGYHAYSTDSGEPRDDATPEALALWVMLKGKTDEEIHAEKVAELVRGLQFSKIPGYFPTPDAVIDIMLDYADVQPMHLVLEPSAGSGAIVDRLPSECLTVVYEINHTLCEILQAKGFDARPVDFLEAGGTFEFDRVLMNPPFEKLQDIDHVLAAFARLKSGGRLVSVMSPGPFFRDTEKCRAFRTFIDESGAEVIDLPDGSFKESGTGVASKLVIIDRE